MSRLPTISELALAFNYIDSEFRTTDTVSSEQWAEGLANAHDVARLDGIAQCDPCWHRVLMHRAKEAYPQLSEQSWKQIAARADYLRACEGDQPRYREST